MAMRLSKLIFRNLFRALIRITLCIWSISSADRHLWFFSSTYCHIYAEKKSHSPSQMTHPVQQIRISNIAYWPIVIPMLKKSVLSLQMAYVVEIVSQLPSTQLIGGHFDFDGCHIRPLTLFLRPKTDFNLHPCLSVASSCNPTSLVGCHL